MTTLFFVSGCHPSTHIAKTLAVPAESNACPGRNNPAPTEAAV
jgi:hypothetical protein